MVYGDLPGGIDGGRGKSEGAIGGDEEEVEGDTRGGSGIWGAEVCRGGGGGDEGKRCGGKFQLSRATGSGVGAWGRVEWSSGIQRSDASGAGEASVCVGGRGRGGGREVAEQLVLQSRVARASDNRRGGKTVSRSAGRAAGTVPLGAAATGSLTQFRSG